VKEIAWKSGAGIRSASFRYRALLPCKYLKREGWNCEIFNYKNLDTYKIVVFQKLYDDENIQLARVLKSRGVKTVFDLCDNHFYYELDNPSALAQRTDRLQKMLDCVDVISVSTPELKKIVSSKTDKEPLVIDDAINIPQIDLLGSSYLKLKKTLRKISSNSLNLVWYGNAGTENPPCGMIDLSTILPILEKLHRETPIKLTVISNSEAIFNKYLATASFPIKYHKWKLFSFPYIFGDNDICLLPVNLNPFTQGKTNNRLILSLLLDVAVIADKLPSYEEFGDFVLFSDWEKSLRQYASNPMLREKNIQQGKQYIMHKYDRKEIIAQWSSLFAKLLN
jgi:hypothetical protein